MTNTSYDTPPGLKLTLERGQILTYELTDWPVNLIVEPLENGNTWLSMTHIESEVSTAYEIEDFDMEQFFEDGLDYGDIQVLLQYLKDMVFARRSWNINKKEVDRREANAGKPALD